MAEKGAVDPDWPTTTRARLSDGRLIGTDNSLWLYRAVPMGPVVDAASPAEGFAVAEPIIAAVEEIAALTSVRITRRSASRSNYRRVHMLLVNVPRFYRPPRDHPLRDYLSSSFATTAIDRRVLLFGVRLRDSIGGQAGLAASVSSIVETLATGMTPLSDYDADFAQVDAALARAGLSTPAPDDLRLAGAWWNQGRYADTPILVHGDHLHVFADAATVTGLAGHDQSGCSDWPTIRGHHAVTFATVQDIELGHVSAASSAAWWVPTLIDQGAVAISIRAQVEPAKVTRAELRRRRSAYESDIAERVAAGKMERAEQEERGAELAETEAAYAMGGPATLVDTSIVVAFNGQVPDIADIGRDRGVALNAMTYRQQAALTETMLCSPVRASPHLHDLPVQTVACSGLPSLATVGDVDGALLGFTEGDRQPAYISPTAAAKADGLPAVLVVGQTGSGKSLTMLNLADQYARMGRPVVIVDPKSGSDHSLAVQASGGQVASLDNLASADGVFDPLRFATRPEIGVEMAASMLLSVNPWGSMRDDFETPLIRALSFGVGEGATCIGQALRLAADAGHAPAEMVSRVFDLAEASAMFRACVGVNPGTNALRMAEGITLIKVGDAHLDLPEPGQVSTASQQQRVAMALVRMMVFGSATALTGRSGVVMLDEAWVFLSAGRSEVERLGRLARSQGVLPMLFTQRVTDALDAGMAGYISRGVILPIADVDEAHAACELFGLEPTAERIGRLTAKATIGSSADASGAPNWHSMRALRDPATGKVLRGAIAIYADLSGRSVPVEVTITEEFLAMASTNPDDVARRLALTAGTPASRDA